MSFSYVPGHTLLEGLSFTVEPGLRTGRGWCGCLPFNGSQIPKWVPAFDIISSKRGPGTSQNRILLDMIRAQRGLYFVLIQLLHPFLFAIFCIFVSGMLFSLCAQRLMTNNGPKVPGCCQRSANLAICKPSHAGLKTALGPHRGANQGYPEIEHGARHWLGGPYGRKMYPSLNQP